MKKTILFVLILVGYVFGQDLEIQQLPPTPAATDTSLFMMNLDSLNNGGYKTRKITIKDFRPSINLADYSIVADGITDNSTKVQRAIDDGQRLNKKIFVPKFANSIGLGSTLNFHNNTHFSGPGKFKSLTNNLNLIDVSSDSNWYIIGLEFEGDNTSSARANGHGIFGTDAYRYVIRDCKFTKFGHAGVFLFDASEGDIVNNIVEQSVVAVAGGGGILLQNGSEYNRIISNNITNTHPWVTTADNNTGVGISRDVLTSAPKYNIVAFNRITGFTQYGITLYGNSFSVTSPVDHDTTMIGHLVHGNTIQQSGFSGIYNAASSWCIISENDIDSTGANLLAGESLPRGGIALNGARFSQIRGGRIRNVVKYEGISASNAFGVSIDGVTIWNTERDGIRAIIGSITVPAGQHGTGKTIEDTSLTAISIKNSKIFSIGQGVNGNGINVSGSGASSEPIHGGIIANNVVRVTSGSGVVLQWCTAFKIIGNWLDDLGLRGIETFNVEKSLISNNVITHIDTADAVQHGIVMDTNSDRNRISNNMIDGGFFGIWIRPSDSTNAVIHNTLMNQSNTAILDNGVNTDLHTHLPENVQVNNIFGDSTGMYFTDRKIFWTRAEDGTQAGSLTYEPDDVGPGPDTWEQSLTINSRGGILVSVNVDTFMIFHSEVPVGKANSIEILKPLLLTETADIVANPPSGLGRLEPRTDGKLYWHNDGGTEFDLTDVVDNAITNTKLANMAAWTIKLRNAGTTGDPQDVKVSTLTEDITPVTGDFILGEVSTGELRKFNVGNLPSTGETNTASNLGGGLANFDSKSGVDLRFNSFAAADFDLAANLISIDDATWLNEAELNTFGQLDTQIADKSLFNLNDNFNISGTNEIQDDVDLNFGNDADWSIQYDEGVDNQLLIETPNTSALTTTDPMLQILVGTTPTANQQIFGVAKGTQATNTDLFTVDEDGDGVFGGNITLTGTVDGRDVATDGTKLDGVESNATADQTDEEIEDVAGPLVATGGTKTRITVTYQDGTGDMDFVVDDMNDDVPEAGDFGALALTGDVTSSGLATTFATEPFQDVAGPLVATGGTKTRITVTYQDATGDMDFVVDDMNDDVPESGDFGNAVDLDADGSLSTDAVQVDELDDGSSTPLDEQLLSYELTGDEIEYQSIVDFLTGGTNLSITGTTNATLNVDDVFLINSGDEEAGGDIGFPDGSGPELGGGNDAKIIWNETDDVVSYRTIDHASANIDFALLTFAVDSDNNGTEPANQEIFEIGINGNDDSDAGFSERMALDEDGDLAITGNYSGGNVTSGANPGHTHTLANGASDVTATVAEVNVTDGYTGTTAEWNQLRDNSIVDALHRHSELVASDGSPDPALTVDGAGEVGIGLINAAVNLHIQEGSLGFAWTPGVRTALIIERNSDGSVLSLITANNGQSEIWFGDGEAENSGRVRYEHTDNSMEFWTMGQERVHITNTGSVGFKTSIPSDNLHIDNAGGTDGTGFRIANRSVSTTNATLTTIYSLATVTDTNYIIRADYLSAQDDGSNEYYVSEYYSISNVGGTVTEDEEQAPPIHETDNDGGASVGLSGAVSGINYLFQVIGVTSENWNHEVTLSITAVAH